MMYKFEPSYENLVKKYITFHIPEKKNDFIYYLPF